MNNLHKTPRETDHAKRQQVQTPVRVLLISPRLPANDSRYCGDYAYTDTLLNYPPPGVEFVHYEELIAANQAQRIAWRQKAAWQLTQRQVLPPDSWFEHLQTTFEPDIVHIVAFEASYQLPTHRHVPLILHASSPSITDLTVKRNWSQEQVERAYQRRRLFFRLTDTHHYALRPDGADRILVQTEFGRRLLLEYGDAEPEKIEVLYPAQPVRRRLEDRTAGRDSEHPVTFLFVGSDFERKNGPLVLKAFRQVREQCPDARLIIVGRPADGQAIRGEGITHRPFVPHDELLDSVFPQADVFVLPTSAEGSFAFTLFEAMSLGLAVVTVDAWAMPEIVVDSETGFLVQPNDEQQLTDHMMRLARNPSLVAQMKRKSADHFAANFSVEAHNRKLRKIYDAALQQKP